MRRKRRPPPCPQQAQPRPPPPSHRPGGSAEAHGSSGRGSAAKAPGKGRPPRTYLHQDGPDDVSHGGPSPGSRGRVQAGHVTAAPSNGTRPGPYHTISFRGGGKVPSGRPSGVSAASPPTFASPATRLPHLHFQHHPTPLHSAPTHMVPSAWPEEAGF